jgi:hypothetical protein
MHAPPFARRWLHRMAERLAAGRHSHRPADPAAAQWQCLDAEPRWRCAAEHRDDLIVGVVAVAGLGVELAGRAEAPPALGEGQSFAKFFSK